MGDQHTYHLALIYQGVLELVMIMSKKCLQGIEKGDVSHQRTWKSIVNLTDMGIDDVNPRDMEMKGRVPFLRVIYHIT